MNCLFIKQRQSIISNWSNWLKHYGNTFHEEIYLLSVIDFVLLKFSYLEFLQPWLKIWYGSTKIK